MGETHKLKFKAQGAIESKIVASQYIGSISELAEKPDPNNNHLTEPTSQLKVALKTLADTTKKVSLENKEG